MNRISYLWGPTGGFGYHMSALLYRHTLWRPFVSHLNEWLCREWAPNTHELIVFGPSAGWTLEREFLERFSRIIAVEPDPLAGPLLRRRFPRTSIDLIARDDLLPWFSNRDDCLNGLLEAHPRAAILFANLLGQLELLKPQMARTTDEARAIFLRSLRGREWASYHDMFSSTTPPRESSEHAFMSGPLSAEKAALEFYSPGARVVDHDTLWLIEDHDWRPLLWQLAPRQYHLIAATKSRAKI